MGYDIPKIMKVVGLFFFGIFSIGFLFSGIFTVDQGETGIVLKGGKAVRTAEPGYNFKIPYLESIVTISNRTFTHSIKKISVYSQDQQPAELEVSITLFVPKDKVIELYSDYYSIDGVVNKIVLPQLESVKNVFGKFKAVTAIQERDRLSFEISNLFRKIILERTDSVQIVSIQLDNIVFSKVYEQAIEESMKVEVEVKKFEQQLAREKIQGEITVTQAKADRDSKMARADGEAKNILLIAEANAKSKILAGEAEAKSISAQTKALNEGGKNLIEYVVANKYKGDVPYMMNSSDKGFIPLLNLQK